MLATCNKIPEISVKFAAIHAYIFNITANTKLALFKFLYMHTFSGKFAKIPENLFKIPEILIKSAVNT